MDTIEIIKLTIKNKILYLSSIWLLINLSIRVDVLLKTTCKIIDAQIDLNQIYTIANNIPITKA
jgi:hypothetical protein